MQLKASVADGDEIVRALFGGGGFRLQPATAGNSQRQRQCGGFDEVPARCVSAAHNDLMCKITKWFQLNIQIEAAKYTYCMPEWIFFQVADFNDIFDFEFRLTFAKLYRLANISEHDFSADNQQEAEQ